MAVLGSGKEWQEATGVELSWRPALVRVWAAVEAWLSETGDADAEQIAKRCAASASWHATQRMGSRVPEWPIALLHAALQCMNVSLPPRPAAPEARLATTVLLTPPAASLSSRASPVGQSIITAALSGHQAASSSSRWRHRHRLRRHEAAGLHPMGLDGPLAGDPRLRRRCGVQIEAAPCIAMRTLSCSCRQSTTRL